MRPPTFTPEQAELLSRGYPHWLRLVDGHPDDAAKKVAKSAKKAAGATDPVYFGHWPREAAGRYLRSFARGRVGAHPNLGGPEADAEVDKAGWPSADEVMAIIRSIVFPPKGGEPRGTNAWGRHAYPFQVAEIVYLLEAEYGTEPVLDAAVATWEEYAAYERRELATLSHRPDNYPAGYLAIPTGMLLLRAGARAEPARRRLQALVAGDASQVHATHGLGRLDLVLNGQKGFQRSGWSWVQPDGWLFVEDDPQWVRAAIAKAKGDVSLDVRAVWLGGEPVISLFVRHARKVKAAEVPRVVEGFGMIRSPATADLMTVLAQKKGGDGAMTWLHEHADLAPAGSAVTTPTKTSRKPRRAEIEAAYDRLTTTNSWPTSSPCAMTPRARPRRSGALPMALWPFARATTPSPPRTWSTFSRLTAWGSKRRARVPGSGCNPALPSRSAGSPFSKRPSDDARPIGEWGHSACG
jgi:hypothetical protein